MDLNQNSTSSEPPNDYGLYVWLMRLNFILNTLISVLVIYLIFKHTPKAMKVYKWFLLNLSLCCYLLDAHLTVTFLPLPIFPVFGGCALGLMRPFGYMAPVIAWIIFIQLLCFTGAAISLALLYRLAAVHGRTDLFERKSVIFLCIVFQCCFGVPALISGLIMYLPEEQSMAYMQHNYPNLIPFYESHSCAVMMVSSAMLIRYLYITMPTVILASVLVNTPIILITRQLSKVKHTVSAKTYKMHKSLTVSLCFQFALVSSMLILSGVFCGIASIYQWKFAQTIFYVSFLFSTTHTAANGVITIAFVKAYRVAFFALLPRILRKRNMVPIEVGLEPMTSNVLFSRYTQGEVRN
ncbi:serpentine type 7TM GPCR chemoreceptor srh domain-containing protein [Ditylenchus destructor]|uniref:Serpentine type 7TM GPCR chemoreceptor srh domain-containing protein n=1 Tax=Ditylenchus destructor TaxID=166010 RepID=A0AAD4MKW4_9BILA|nr:serpentine type 7TM GPCR chemoreceptor srh domain-containing protein [Ditylenchus destructor]